MTTHVLINFTESVGKTLDEGSFGCGIFSDLQKAFDNVNRKILLRKLEYYEICGVCNDWFKSYLSDRKQFVSINGSNSDLIPVNCGAPQFILTIFLWQMNIVRGITVLMIQIIQIQINTNEYKFIQISQ